MLNCDLSSLGQDSVSFADRQIKDGADIAFGRPDPERHHALFLEFLICCIKAGNGDFGLSLPPKIQVKSCQVAGRHYSVVVIDIQCGQWRFGIFKCFDDFLTTECIETHRAHRNLGLGQIEQYPVDTGSGVRHI